jgi:PKD repeat protein
MSLPNNKLTIVVDNPICANANVENSNASYTNSVPSGGTLILPTQEIQNNGVASGFIPSVGTINVTTNAAPTSFTITGRTIDIVVPSGGGSLAVDFSVNDTTPDTNQTITFTDLTIGATSWVWNFGDGTSSSLQNPTKVYAHSGVYNVTLSASDGTISGEEVKTSYITCTLQALPSTNIQMHNQALIGASPSNATLVSGAISQWNDAINSYHRTQGTAANRPTYLYPAVTAPNGIVYGAARFDGTNDFLINNNAGFTRATGSFEVIVLNIRVVGSVNVYLESASSGNLYEVYSLDNLQTIGMFNSTAISSIQTHHVGIYSVFYIHWNTTLSFMDWCNRSKRTVSSTPGNSSAVGSTMGAAFNGAFASPIDVLEHIIYTAKPSDADIALIQQRIIAQYGNIF